MSRTLRNDFLDLLARARAAEPLTGVCPHGVPITAEFACDACIEPAPVGARVAESLEGMALGSHRPARRRTSGPYADLVGVSDIAERLSVPRSIVGKWIEHRPTNGFPTAVHQVRAGRLFRWSEVETWYRAYVPQRGKTKPGRLP
jgi:hypothetical protein